MAISIAAMLFMAGCQDAPVVAETDRAADAAVATVDEAASPDTPPTRFVAADLDVPSPTRAGRDWPLFLGLTENGIVPEAEANAGSLIDDLSTAENAWIREVGSGYSAPAVVGLRTLLFHRQGDEEVLECLRADTGETLWKTARPSSFRDPYGYNNGPRCSPQVHLGDGDESDAGGYVITFGATGRLMRTSLADGDVAWEIETDAAYDVPKHFFGVGCTPILERVGDRTLAVTLVGGQPNSGVVAFDAADGSVVWEAVGRSTWDGVVTRDRRGRPDEPYEWNGFEMVVSYASPIAATIHGERHLLCLVRQGLVSLDPATGEERFAYWFRSPIHESVNASRPVVVDDTILLSAPYNAGCVRLRVNPDGRGVTELWRTSDEFDTHFSTAIYRDGHYYGFHGRHENQGQMTCIDAATGEVKWASSGYEGNLSELRRGQRGGYVDADGQPLPWPFYGRGSAILVGDRFLVLGERGTLAWVNADPSAFVETSRVAVPEIGYPSWAAPVLSRGRAFFRDENSLICLDLRRSDDAAVKPPAGNTATD